MTAMGSGAPFEITRATGHCASTGKELAPGDRVRTILFEEDPSTPLRRVDVLSSADQPEHAGTPVATWVWTVPEGRKTDRPLLDDDSMFDLFERLEGAEGRQEVFRYLLALMLMRKRILVLEGRAERDDGTHAFELRGRGRFGGPDRPTWQVTEPKLDEAAIEAALEEMSVLLTDGEDTP